VALLTGLLYLPVLGFGFVFDDFQYITGNPPVAGGLGPSSLGWAFSTGYAGNWHPLTWLSLMADVSLFGLRPGPMHLVNLLFHAANTALLCQLLTLLTGARLRSAMAALLFGIHPLHVESVAWITERKDLLSTLFGLLAVLAYAAFVRRGGIARYLGLLLLFAASLLAKPMLVTLPFLLLLLDYWPLERWRPAGGDQGPPLSRLVLEKVPLLALSVASGAVTLVVQSRDGAVQSLEYFPLVVRLKNAALSYLTYLVKTLAPFGLSIVYQHQGGDIPTLRALGAAAVLLGLTWASLGPGRRRRYLAVGWLWYLGTLVPVIGLVQVGGQAMADRYSYIPLVGIFVAGVWGTADLLGRVPRGKWIGVGLSAILALSLGVLSFRQIGFWRDDTTLFHRALAVNPGNWMALNNLAGAYSRLGRTKEATLYYRQALQLNPAFRAVARFQTGEGYFGSGRYQEAIGYYREALQLKPDFPEAMLSLGLSYARTGRRDEALRQVEELRRLRSPLAEELAAYLN
jgi:tetratricopeptide (TPR) repeat protein